jgi:RNA polymerase sigma-70 factor, ECF subfamily
VSQQRGAEIPLQIGNLRATQSDRAAEVSTDEELIAAMAAGDRVALERLYRRHAPWIAGRLSTLTSSRDLAEETLQDTFLSAWRGARHYRGEGPVGAWLWGIARRRLVSLARRRPGALPEEREIEPPGPEEIVISHEDAAQVRLAVARLPVDQRAAIEAVVFEGRSVAEAAASLGVAEGTIKSRLHRARLRIREELER